MLRDGGNGLRKVFFFHSEVEVAIADLDLQMPNSSPPTKKSWAIPLHLTLQMTKTLKMSPRQNLRE